MKFKVCILLLLLLILNVYSTKTKTQTQAKTKAKTQAKTQATTTSKTQTAATATTQMQTQAKSQSKAKSQSQAKATSKTSTSAQAQAQSTTSMKSKTKFKTKTLSKKQLEELLRLKNEASAKVQLEHLTAEEKESLLKKAKEEEAGKTKIQNVPIKYNIEGQGVIWQGWVKYFHYTNEEKSEKPDHFYENPSFFTEQVLYERKNDKGVNGNYKYIQDKYHFWGKLLPSGNFNVLGSRNHESDTLAENVENLNTDLIQYIHPSNNAGGAIRDLGYFNEGYCIKVETSIPDNKKNLKYNSETAPGEEEIVWIICTDKESDKKSLMSNLVSLKLKRQREIEDDRVEEKALSVAELMNVKPFKPVIEKYKGLGASDDDGYWIQLQDWSECSQECGEGFQIQQWMCVPPKNHGKPCIGNAIRRKPCNVKPCPDIYGNGIVPKEDSTHITLKAKYKAMPYSKRPQQYIKCMIKENDVLYLTKEYDPEKKKAVKVPGRIVMNTKTISVYKDDGYSNQLFSFNLEDTTFSKSEKDFCCFYLTSRNRQFDMCGFNNNCGTSDDPIWTTKWGNDFEYFKTKCHEDLISSSKYSKGNKNKEQGPYNDGIPLSQAQKDIVEGRRAIIQKKIEDKTERKMDDQVDATQKVALTAIRREINLEDLIKNEEIQKGQIETQQLFEQMKQEKKKKDLLEQALLTRENNFGKVRIAKDTQNKINGIKAETKVDIKFKRGVLKKKIEEIRNKFRRKHRQIKQQIQMIRAEMAKEIMNANKKGNRELCKEGRKNMVKMKEYCDRVHTDDYVKNMNCKDPQNFCYSCCESEFGNMFIADRDECTNMCDELEKADLDNGDWVWAAGDQEKADKDTPVGPPESNPNAAGPTEAGDASKSIDPNKI